MILTQSSLLHNIFGITLNYIYIYIYIYIYYIYIYICYSIKKQSTLKATLALNEVFDKKRTSKIKKVPHTVLEKTISQNLLQNFFKIGLNPIELELSD